MSLRTRIGTQIGTQIGSKVGTLIHKVADSIHGTRLGEDLQKIGKSIEKKFDLSRTETLSLRDRASSSREISSFLEGHSPWLSRQFLGVASNMTEPFVVGMGLRIAQLSEELIEVKLPGGWRNQAVDGKLHPGALVTLGEFATRHFWEHHLDLRSSELSLAQLEMRTFGRPQGTVQAVYRVLVSEREKYLHRLRSDGLVEVESHVAIYDDLSKLVAQIEIHWRIAKQLTLGPAAATDG